jgi:hypothetical protein
MAMPVNIVTPKAKAVVSAEAGLIKIAPDVELPDAAAAFDEAGEGPEVEPVGAVVPLVKKAGTVPMTGSYGRDTVVLSVPSQQKRLKQDSHSALRCPPFSVTALSIKAQVKQVGQVESVPLRSSVRLPFSTIATA